MGGEEGSIQYIYIQGTNMAPTVEGSICWKIPSHSGGGYQLMSFGGKDMERGREKRENVMGRTEKKNERKGSKRVK
jgi:hypothetical protein